MPADLLSGLNITERFCVNNILAEHYMSNFENRDSMAKWASKYHVYTPYSKHIEMCWSAMCNHVGKSDEHKLDYLMIVYKNNAGKFCLAIKRKIRKINK